MYILSILITGALDKHNLLNGIRDKFIALLKIYLDLFHKYQTNNQRQIRYLYILVLVPIFIVLALVKILFLKYSPIIDLINLILFMLSCQMFSWKEEAHKKASLQEFINTYALKFFAPLFWFFILPTFGPICYLVITLISTKIKDNKPDLIVYNMTVDKMLFYVNIIPFLVLYFFLAIAGNFEEILHFVLSKKNELNSKSFYTLENILKDVVLISIGKSKFQNNTLVSENDDYLLEYSSDEKISDEVKPYIVAILYRTGLFFISVLAIVDLTIIMH